MTSPLTRAREALDLMWNDANGYEVKRAAFEDVRAALSLLESQLADQPKLARLHCQHCNYHPAEPINCARCGSMASLESQLPTDDEAAATKARIAELEVAVLELDECHGCYGDKSGTIVCGACGGTGLGKLTRALGIGVSNE